MSKKKKTSGEIVCFCQVSPDVSALLRRQILQTEYTGSLLGVLDDGDVEELEAMLSPHLRVAGTHVHWSVEAPPIEIAEEHGEQAKVHIRQAREELKEIVAAQPHAWFAPSTRSRSVAELDATLARCTSLVRLRWPDVATHPVPRAGFWLCHALADALCHETSGAVMLRDGAFVARGGEVIDRADRP